MGKRGSIFCFVITCLLLICSCSNSGIPKGKNEFIQHFLDKNSKRIYKSEIQRVKVNFFHSSGMLVYSFWNEAKFKENGDLFLHLYPNDTNMIIGHRRKHKFVNLAIGKNEIFNESTPFSYFIQYLQLPYGLSTIQTGQYNDSVKTWKSVYTDKGVLKKTSRAKMALLKGKNIPYAITIYKQDNNSPFLGPKIFQSKNDKTVVFYNSSLNRLTFLTNELKKDEWADRTIFVNVISKEGHLKRKSINYDDFILKDRTGHFTYELGLNEIFSKLEVGHVEDGTDVSWKVLEVEKLVHSTFPLRNEDEVNKPTNKNDRDIEMIIQLISSNLPMAFASTDGNLGLFLNKEARTAYIVSRDADNFDSFTINSSIKRIDQSENKEIRLQNSFYIKGEKKQLVVHEIDLPQDDDSINLRLHSSTGELYHQNINFMD